MVLLLRELLPRHPEELLFLKKKISPMVLWLRSLQLEVLLQGEELQEALQGEHQEPLQRVPHQCQTENLKSLNVF